VCRIATPLALASILACAGFAAPAEAPAATLVSPLPAHARDFARAASAGGTAAPGRHHRPRVKSGCAVVKHHTRSARRCAPRRTKPTRNPAPAAPPQQHSVVAGAKASQSVTIAKVLATPCQNTELTPEAANLALVRAAILCLVNTERAQNGLDPLETNPRLEAAAESHGREMISVDYFDHVSPSGVTPVDRVRGAGYIPSPEDGYVIGENLAWGTLSLSTPASIVAAWIASPEHLANILEGKYRETGIDVEPEAPASLAEHVQGALYTQEFGVVVH